MTLGRREDRLHVTMEDEARAQALARIRETIANTPKFTCVVCLCELQERFRTRNVCPRECRPKLCAVCHPLTRFCPYCHEERPRNWETDVVAQEARDEMRGSRGRGAQPPDSPRPRPVAHRPSRTRHARK